MANTAWGVAVRRAEASLITPLPSEEPEQRAIQQRDDHTAEVDVHGGGLS